MSQQIGGARDEAPDSPARDDWLELVEELDRWRAAGLTARFWWRDDDAVTVTPALDRLLDLSTAHAVPLGLAVVPMPAEEELARQLPDYPLVSVLQHGIAHIDHAAPGSPYKTELGGILPPEAIDFGLVSGRQRLGDMFGARLLPILVPPWGDIPEALVARLPGIGYRGLSILGDRPKRAAGPSEINAHVQPIDFRRCRYAGTGIAIERAIEPLRQRRSGKIDRAEPIGLLTHHNHVGMDDATWEFVARFISMTEGHCAAEWISPRQAFELDA